MKSIKETSSNNKSKSLIIQRIRHWLLTRKWLWKKVVFDNGIVGKNYTRYDHRVLPYTQGMGENGRYGGLNEAIEKQVTLMKLISY